jgi:acetylornithine deacetylase/succinyl-diaminopimelate desuccinylase-like protein
MALLRPPPAAALDEMARRLAHDIFQQLIEINTADSVGSMTRAAEAMAKRSINAALRRKTGSRSERPQGNLVARLRGGGGLRKPILIIGHLYVVEAARELDHRSLSIRRKRRLFLRPGYAVHEG